MAAQFMFLNQRSNTHVLNDMKGKLHGDNGTEVNLTYAENITMAIVNEKNKIEKLIEGELPLTEL